MSNHLKKQQGELVPFIQNGEYFFKKALKAYRHRDLGKSKRLLERALYLDPKQSLYLCQLAIVYSEMEKYKESNNVLLSIIDGIEPDLVDCYYLIANNYAHLGLFQESKKYAYKYMEEAPDGEYIEDTHDLLDLLNIELDEIDIDDFQDEDELILKQEEACQLLEQGDLVEASTLLEELVKGYPEFWSAQNNLALAHFYLGEHEQALELTSNVLEKSKGNLHALCNLVIFHHYMNHDERVTELIRELKKVYPIDFDHRYKLGTTFALVGQFKKAYDWLRWLYKYKYDGDAAFYYWLSVSSYQLGHVSFAKGIWEKVIRLNPAKKGSEPWAELDSIQHTEK